MEYLRIGTDYYKICNVPLLSGDTIKSLIKWSKGEIMTDFGKEFLKEIKKYDGFIIIPDHKNYEQEINGFYNEYEKVNHKLSEGKFTQTELFLKHIFKNQYNIALDYLTIIWQHPSQILPILCLVSEERNTGKTTFLKWLKLVFQGNMTINKNEDFRSRFNSDWASKLIIAVDEVLLDKKEDSERIKNLSTANNYKIESKGKDKVETTFFGKFILCSNNEENFIQIDSNEIRYWVVKVVSIVAEDVNMLQNLEKEIPHFLHYINNRKIVAEQKTRMWFTKQQIYTAALDKVVKGNKTYLSQEIREIIIDDFVSFEVDVLKYTASDLLEKLSKGTIRTTRFKISDCLKMDYKLTPTNGSYPKYFTTMGTNNTTFVDSEQKKGRYFEFLKKDFLENTVELLQNSQNP